MQEPLLTIIVPVYNVAAYLPRCLDSLVEQTYRNLEVICVNDGSTDASAAILDEYAARDSRIRVIHQQNAGVSAARNNGLAVAKGQIIGFCDADDCYTKEALRQVKEVFAKNECSLVVTGFIHVNSVGQRFPVCFPSETAAASREVQEFMLYDGRVLGYAWNKFFRREILENMAFDVTQSHCEDMLFVSAVLCRFPEMSIIIAPVVTCEHFANSTSATSNPDKLLDENGQLRYISALTAISKMYPGDLRLLQLVDSTLFRLLDVNSDFFQDRPEVVRRMAVEAMRYALPYLFCRKHQPLIERIGRVWQMVRRVLFCR